MALFASLWPPFLVGLFGAVHCATMCGGIAAAVGMRSRRKESVLSWQTSARVAKGASGTLRLSPLATAGDVSAVTRQTSASACIPAPGAVSAPRLLAFNGGRILTYSILGAVAGSAGSVAWLAAGLLPIQRIAFGMASLVLIAMGAYLMGERRFARRLEALGRPLWNRVRPFAAKLLAGDGSDGVGRFALTGAVWGLVPCAMVYGVLLGALASGSPVYGALLMLAFGIGTLPNLLALSWSASWLSGLRSHPQFRIVAAVLLMSFGVIGLARLVGAPLGPLADLVCFVPASIVD